MTKNYNKFFNNMEPETLSPYEIGEIVKPKKPVTDTIIPETIKCVGKNRCKLNLRKTPTKDGEIITVLNKGTTLFIKDVNDDWARVTTPSDIDGYVIVYFLDEEI